MSDLLKGSLGFKGNKGDTGEIGTPIPYRGTFEQLKNSDMNKYHNYIILDNEDTNYVGHWVYYDRTESTWKDGGVYLAQYLTEEVEGRLNEVENIVEDNYKRQEELEKKYEEQIENIASGEYQNAEIVDARSGFTTLKKRLDNSDKVKADKTTTTNLQTQIDVEKARIDNITQLPERKHNRRCRASGYSRRCRRGNIQQRR